MVEEFLATFGAQKNESAQQIIELRQQKADRKALVDVKNYINEQLQGFDAKLDKQRGDQLTLEHYTERYIPVQVQGMITDNLERIHDEKTMKLIKSEENQLYMKMQRQLMDMTNFTDGTIFDNVLKINAEMTKKMNLRVDLTTNTAVADQGKKEDKATALERKLNDYI